ncbi:MAG: D-amino-acid transaminase [Ralstonia sp.]|uniref:D-amino-acid transaminase n=1 Tax=Ralstonia sp. TaxID=54061 RepID=UPI003F7EC7D8
MSRIIFLNGQYVPAAEATVSVMDRGFTFADGIYEVTAVARGKLVDNDAHLARLTRSLSEIGIDNPYTAAEWTRVCEELVARNGLEEGVVYMQVTRGVAERDFGIPADITPTAVAFTQVKSIVNSPLAKKGATVVTVPDLRWKRCDIKSVGLLPQVMAKQIAARAGAHEAWMADGDRVTEGASSTAFIITADKRLITRPLSNAVLPGITRVSILALAREHGLTLEERAFTVAEAQQAAEAFYTSASTFVMPVVSIDGVQIGNGQPGPLTQALRTLYLRFAGVDVAEPVGQM